MLKNPIDAVLANFRPFLCPVVTFKESKTSKKKNPKQIQKKKKKREKIVKSMNDCDVIGVTVPK